MFYTEDIKRKDPLIKKIVIMAAGLITGLVLSRIFFVSFIITDSSMLPGLKKGERIIVLRHITPDRGDIVLLESPIERGRVLLKRIIAKESDTVEIKNKTILINKKKASFSWTTTSRDKRILPSHFTFRDNMPAIRLDRNDFFVICDNLDFSFDSRTFGLVKNKSIIGKMIFKF